MKTPYVDLKLQWRKDKPKLLPIIENILSKGSYVIGEEVDKFEKPSLAATSQNNTALDLPPFMQI